MPIIASKIGHNSNNVHRHGSTASDIVNAHKATRGSVNIYAVAQDLANLAKKDPTGARLILQQVRRLLSPAHQGELNRILPSVIQQSITQSAKPTSPQPKPVSNGIAKVTSAADKLSAVISAAESYASNGGKVGNWTAVVQDGKIVKIYQNGFKGNQWVVTQNASKALGPLLSKVGPGLAVIGIHSSILQYSNNQIGGAHLTANLTMAAVGFMGPVGAGISVTYGLIDAFYPGGAGQFGRDVNNSPYVKAMGHSIHEMKQGGCPPMFCGI